MINILIVHYNTPTFTECLIKSINNFVGAACHIYIFDNSDRKPFTYKQDNITLFDNTKGQIINFNEWLNKYPNHRYSLGAASKWGSFKHCISVDKCFDLIGESFILLDSDVLLKKDITELFNKDYVSCGEQQDWSWKESSIYPRHRRLLPFITFINVEFCKEKNIRYFNPEYMDGFYDSTHLRDAEQLEKDSYDTGCWFYTQIPKDKIKIIKCEEYIVHFRGASYTNFGRNENLTEQQWLKKYKTLYKEKNKKVVYTCITGGYDGLIEPSYITPDFDYVCYTDNKNITSNIWKLRDIPENLSVLGNKKINRYIKTHPHEFFKDYDLSIYVDGSILIKNDLNVFLNEKCNGNSPIIIPKHPARNCIYREADVCIKMKKDTAENINKQTSKYRTEGFPTNYGLTQNNIIIRKHNDKACIKLMETWWNEIKNGSYRDQLSFMYALWKTPEIQLKQIDSNTCNSTYFKWYALHNWKSPYVKRNTTIRPQFQLNNLETQQPSDIIEIHITKPNTFVRGIETKTHPKRVIKKTKVFLGTGLNW